MKKHSLYSLVCCSAIPVIVLLGACSPSNETIGGGYSEETNTLAGILTNEKGEPQANVQVLARHTKANISEVADTTDSEGKFEFHLDRQGIYGLSATKKNKAMYKMVDFSGQNLNVKVKMVSVNDVSGSVQLRNDTAASEVYVSIPGSPWEAKTDDEGSFDLKKVPQGTYPVVTKSPDPIRYVDAFYIAKFKDGSAEFAGPYPIDMIDSIMSKVDSNALNESEDSSIVLESSDGTPVAMASSIDMMMPISTEYGLQCWWPFDYLTDGSAGTKVSSDARGRTDGVVFYGSPELSEGVSRKSINLNGASQYGVVENDRNALDSATEFTLEAWVNLAKLPKESVYRKNIVGKLGFGSEADQNVFSLSLVKGECGVKNPRLAFFIAEGSKGDSLDCENMVLSGKVAQDEWMYVTSVWNGDSLSMYINGALVDSRKTSVKKINPSSEPVIFGKENLNLKLDDVRLSKKAINSADVLYRYYLKGGAL